jgi:dihydroorotase
VADQKALIDGIKTGVLEAIAINHTPYTYTEKTVAFSDAPPGAIGLEIALPLLWQHLVATGNLSALQLWQSLSTKPAQCLQQFLSPIAPDQPAEVILFDPQQTWQCDRASLKSIATNTPWLGKEIKGRVIKTWRF